MRDDALPILGGLLLVAVPFAALLLKRLLFSAGMAIARRLVARAEAADRQKWQSGPP